MTDKLRSSVGGALLLAVLAGLLGAQTKVLEKNLSPKYREWIKLTTTFILPAEREVFMALENDRERDIFIEAFWKQRDPTEGTPQNEFKDEMEARFKHVNEYFRRGTVREGWMTDMGRIYMTLGAPRSVERFEGNAGLYPVQVWYYSGDGTKGLPASFVMIFFQRGGGEFKLYNPVSDGPGSFVIDAKGLDLTDHRAMYEKIRELAPTLATVSLSLVPGQVPYGYAPSPQASFILAQVFDSPKKGIDPAYATHFLNYRGIVSTEYLTNYVESDATVEIVRDAILGLDFLHFALSPKKVSIDYYRPKDEYFCNFKLSVSLRRGDAVVFQYSRDYPFYFPADRAANVQANGVAVQDLFPVAEGEFALSVLLQNAVGKEFSLLERTIDVPSTAGPAALAKPIVGYGLRDAAGAAVVPFRVLGREILTDPRETLSLSDDLAFAVGAIRIPRGLWAEGSLEIAAAGTGTEGRTVPVQSIRLTDLPYARAMTFTGKIAARGLAPDYYELLVTLKNGEGEAIDEAKASFILSPATAVPHPVTVARPLPAASDHLYYYGLAIQYDKIGDTARAEALLEKAYALRPDHLEGVVQFADFLIRTDKPERALEVAEELAADGRFRFDYCLLKGLALKGKGEYTAAIRVLLEGNKIYNSDTRLLNVLGFCFYKTGQKQPALDSLNASLRLNPEQKDIVELRGRVEKELK